LDLADSAAPVRILTGAFFIGNFPTDEDTLPLPFYVSLTRLSSFFSKKLE
jgi:hypothetical protein